MERPAIFNKDSSLFPDWAAARRAVLSYHIWDARMPGIALPEQHPETRQVVGEVQCGRQTQQSRASRELLCTAQHRMAKPGGGLMPSASLTADVKSQGRLHRQPPPQQISLPSDVNIANHDSCLDRPVRQILSELSTELFGSGSEIAYGLSISRLLCRTALRKMPRLHIPSHLLMTCLCSYLSAPWNCCILLHTSRDIGPLWMGKLITGSHPTCRIQHIYPFHGQSRTLDMHLIHF